MMAEYKGCENCPFKCDKEGEDRRWCFIRILRLEFEQEKKRKGKG